MSRQSDIEDTTRYVAQRAGYRCEVCGKPTPLFDGQLAHKIPQRKHLLKLYGSMVIHHPLNMVWTCSLECNAKVSIGGRVIEIERLVSRIKAALISDKS